MEFIIISIKKEKLYLIYEFLFAILIILDMILLYLYIYAKEIMKSKKNEG